MARIEFITKMPTLALFAAILLLPSVTMAQTSDYKSPMQPDYTQDRGREVKEQGTRLTGQALIKAFSGKTHYGTYIYNRQNEITARYTETHFPDGQAYYNDSAGPDTGRWRTPNNRLCYEYDGPMSGGCFEIWALDGCYYFFNSMDQYDGYSIAPGKTDRNAPQCIPLIG